MGDETGKQNWHVLVIFSFGQDSYIEFFPLRSCGVSCMPEFRLSWEDVGGRGLASSEPVLFASTRNNEQGMRNFLRKESASFGECVILRPASLLEHQGPTAGTAMK